MHLQPFLLRIDEKIKTARFNIFVMAPSGVEPRKVAVEVRCQPTAKKRFDGARARACVCVVACVMASVRWQSSAPSDRSSL